MAIPKKKREVNPKESLIKSTKIPRKTSKKMKTTTAKNKVSKNKKRITIQKPCTLIPGRIKDIVIWEEPTPFDEIFEGDEVVTACGYHGFVDSKWPNSIYPSIALIDMHGHGYRTVMTEAIIKISDGKNDPEYVYEMERRKASKKQGNISTIVSDINLEENEDD